MKRDLQSRLNHFRRSGELKSGRQLADELKRELSDHLFPGEGREEETPFGRCYLRELKFPLDYRHGSSTLEGILTCSGSNLAIPSRDNQLQSFNPHRAIFLDIETTGLAGGTGTWAFLIGTGRVEQGYFILRQYFLRRPAEERALLSHFATEAEAYPTMITFNGKMFDLPLIQTRQLLSGFRQTEPETHLDLLHCARILWRKRLASRSLRSIEEALLGLQRHDDIPGAEIPAVYFDYLRRGKTERLKTVFNHNVLDILSMVTLLERISLLGGGSCIEHPAEALALGRLLLSTGRDTEGISYLQQAAYCNRFSLAGEAALELARYYKRKGNWPEAIEIWQSIVERDQTGPAACVELAKYHEHHRRDYGLATEYAGKALIMVERFHNPSANGELSRSALLHRIERLKRKQNRAAYPEH